MLALKLTAPLLAAALGLGGAAPARPESPPAALAAPPSLELSPIASLLPEPRETDLLAAALGDASSSEPAKPRTTGLSRRTSGALVLLSSAAALGASFLVMPLTDALEPDSEPNQGAMVARGELIVYSVGAAVAGSYLLLSSLWASPPPKDEGAPTEETR